jgi:LPXTG-site transpeptidase (sortase) family protein
LEVGDMIELVWNGKQFIYSVEETVIKNPKDVNDIIEAYKNNKYLTLMACYPRFSTAKRILVIAKEMTKEDLSKRTMALHMQSPL